MATTKKPSLPPLQTPQTASFPSEIVETPLSALPPAIKQETGLKTPITPPIAYTEFLKALTPVLISPRQTPALPRTSSSESAPGRETPTSGHSSGLQLFLQSTGHTQDHWRTCPTPLTTRAVQFLRAHAYEFTPAYDPSVAGGLSSQCCHYVHYRTHQCHGAVSVFSGGLESGQHRAPILRATTERHCPPCQRTLCCYENSHLQTDTPSGSSSKRQEEEIGRV